MRSLPCNPVGTTRSSRRMLADWPTRHIRGNRPCIQHTTPADPAEMQSRCYRWSAAQAPEEAVFREMRAFLRRASMRFPPK